MAIPPQISRPLLIAAGGAALFFTVRTFFVPESFGEKGHYRANALGEVAAAPLAYAGKESCADCHSEVTELLAKGKHRTQSCETCHGPLAGHSEDSEIPAGKVGALGACAHCHEKSPARPAKFPQVDFQNHKQGKPCLSCHKPHLPEKAG